MLRWEFGRGVCVLFFWEEGCSLGSVHLGWGTAEETALVAPGVPGLPPLCCRNVSSVRSGGKGPPAAACSVLTAAARLPST